MIPPAIQDIYRYRKQYGVNIAGWFVLEKWVDSRPFDGIEEGDSDREVARVDNAKQIVEQHWDTFMGDADWEWLQDCGINTIRLPIGYYHVVGTCPGLLDGTEFEAHAETYQGAWSRILNAIAKAALYGIGVLVDLHAAPGGEFHSDRYLQAAASTKLWTSKNVSATIKTLQVLVTNLAPLKNVVGLSLLNEPPTDPRLMDWYTAVLNTLRAIDADFPLYISDMHYPETVANTIAKRSDFVVMDHHLYRASTDPVDDDDYDGEYYAELADTEYREAIAGVYERNGGKTILGEWCASPFPKTANMGNTDEVNEHIFTYGAAQLQVYNDVCAGQFYWTYKRGPRERVDIGWSLLDAVREGVMQSNMGVKQEDGGLSLLTAEAKSAAKDKLSGRWRTHWAMQPHPCAYEHWRFDAGFMQGFEDQKDFIKLSPGVTFAIIGFRDQWGKGRAAEHEQSFGGNEFLWEFDEGFRIGCQAALDIYFGNEISLPPHLFR